MSQDALLLELETTREELRREREALRLEREVRAAREAELRARSDEVARLLAENAGLRARVDLLARRMFGRSSEKIDPGQLLLAFEVAQAEAKAEDSLETAAGEETEATPRPRRVRPTKKKSMADLPVREVRVEPDEEARRCAHGHEKTRIGEEVSEQVEYEPAAFHVVRTVRGKWACAKCQDGVVTAPPPPTAIERSVAAPGLVALIVTSKYADHSPLYRQEGVYARWGLDLSRTTMKDVVAAAAERLLPVALAVKQSVMSGRVVNSDDTPVTYLTPPKGSATGYVWAYVGEKGEVAYDFTPGRSRDGPVAFVGEFGGHFQADAYAGYDVLFEDGRVLEVGCWAHARRHFVDARETDRDAVEPVLALIQRLYAVEAAAKGMAEPERRLMRLERSRPLLAELRRRIDATPVALPKGPLGKAVGYAQRHWAALTRYLDEGFLSIDNNAAERALRPIALGRKNWMFAGSLDAGRRAATLMTLVESCKLQGVDPFRYLKDVLVRVATTPASRVRELTPRAWKAARDAAPRG